MHEMLYVTYTVFVLLLTKLCVHVYSYFLHPNKQGDWYHEASFSLRQNIEQTNIYSGLLSCDT